MAGGGLSVAAAGGVEFEAKITPIVIISCIMAATGGLMFGYDVGVSGGVTAMPAFLKKFFPVVYRKTQSGELDSNYCKYDNQGLQLFTSSLYLAGLTATFFASYTTRKLGRRLTMLIAGVFFIIGVILNAGAQNLAMLIVGRILLGCGVGFANQAVPVFLSEIAPTRIRGGLNILFQLNVTIGILFANLVNYGTAKIEGGWGWRLSLGLAGIPALLLTVGALLVVDTPNSLIERGKLDEGKAVLKKIRGTDNVEPEYLELVEASRIAKEVKHPFRNLLQRKNRPPLIISIALQFFQQFTGINAIMFYAPVLFSTLGFKSDASLYSTVITGAVNVISTIVSIYSVDKVGRRFLLLEAGVQMFFAQVIIAIILGIKVTDTSDNLSTGFAVLVVIMVCTFISAFAWSWGPLGWLIPSETFPLETRSAGQSVTVCINLLFTFVIAQAFLSMLCHFKFGIFLFFSGWVFIMSIFVWFLVPETKNIPIEEMTERVWKKHWLWKRFMDDAEYVQHHDLAKKNGFVLKLIAVDWFKLEASRSKIALHPKSLVQSEAGKKLPFVLVVNLQVPAKPNYSLVMYYAADRPVNKDSLLGKFIDGNDAFRDSRFKLIPSIVQGYWMVKRAVGTKACLLGKAVTCHYLRQDNFLEIDVDIGSSSVARSVIGLVLGYVTSLVVDLAILIEGREEKELPEYILGTVRLNKVKLDTAVPLEG